MPPDQTTRSAKRAKDEGDSREKEGSKEGGKKGKEEGEEEGGQEEGGQEVGKRGVKRVNKRGNKGGERRGKKGTKKTQSETGRIPFQRARLRKKLCVSHLQPRLSGTKNQPKEEVLARISLRTSGQKLRSGPPNPGKTSILGRTSRADVHEKNFGQKNFGLIFRSLELSSIKLC